MRQPFAVFAAAGAVSLALGAQALAQIDFAKVESRITKVAGNVYMIDGVGGFAGGTIGVSVGDDGVLLVDDQLAPMIPKIQGVLATVTKQPVRFVLNTHWHGDHTHGNSVLGQTATIIAHDNVRTRMAADEHFNGPGQKAPTPKVALPVITFSDTATVHFNGEEIRALHTAPGHTDGDTVVFFTKSNVVHMGDNFFNGMFPFVDLESGGTVRGMIAAIELVAGRVPADAKVIPGHGPLASVEDLRAYAVMLK
ncbi:MAG TPA: MBL fold metallo-hydrolase, partial [Vicinamibacteria bacterium]|nr:MBL fold metallo-hydrolase [Vicinamibacteria bacterium]